MAKYQTVEGEQVVYNGELFFIGQKRKIVSSRGRTPGIGLKKLKDGMEFFIRNIIYPTFEPEVLFLCCEYVERIGGHTCSADRRGLPPWGKEYLCKDGHGEYLTIEKAYKSTAAVGGSSLSPSWEL